MTIDLSNHKKEQQKVALIVGGSGLIGQQLLRQLLANNAYCKVIALVRKPLTLKHSKLEQWQVDFRYLAEELKYRAALAPDQQSITSNTDDSNESDISAHIHTHIHTHNNATSQTKSENSKVTRPHSSNVTEASNSLTPESLVSHDLANHKLASIDDIFCTLGTTIKKAGSKAAFTEVDYHYPLIIAKHFKQKNTAVFAIVTAMAANASSAIFYNQTKGKVESSLRNIGFKHLGIFRPSMLSGQRSEYRLGEHLGSIIMSAFAFLIPKKYQIIEAKKVASAMVAYAENPQKGVTIIQSDQLQKY